MKEQKQFNFKLPKELYDHIKLISEMEYTNMTRYVVQLILDDKRKKQKELSHHLGLHDKK